MVTLEWIASPINDMYADAILCSILQAESMETTPSYVPAIGSKEDKMHFKECLIEMLQVRKHMIVNELALKASSICSISIK